MAEKFPVNTILPEIYPVKSSSYIAYGSTCELKTQLLLSGDLGAISIRKACQNFREISGRLRGC